MIAGIGGFYDGDIKGLERHRRPPILQANRNLLNSENLYDARMEIASEDYLEDGQYHEIIVSRAAESLNYGRLFSVRAEEGEGPTLHPETGRKLKRYQEIGYENVREKIERIKEQLYENQNDR